MKFFDVHCHTNFKAFNRQASKVIKQAQAQGVRCLAIGTDHKTCQIAIDQAKVFSNVFAAVGFHPIHTKDRQWPNEIKKIAALAKHPVVKAIGEIGFDDFYIKPNQIESELRTQEKIFDYFLALALELKKPVLFHCRGPIRFLRQKIEQNLSGLKRVGAMLHCFPGDQNLAKFLIRQKFYLGFNGIIFRNHQWNEIIAETPLKNILIETDAPFLNPLNKNRLNYPSNVKIVAQRIAQIKKMPIKEVARITTQNAIKFLHL